MGRCDFAGQPALPASLYIIAERYDLSRNFEDANNVYQQIADNHPDSPQAGSARLALAKLNIIFLIDAGDDAAVEIALDNLIADFNDHPELPTAVFMVGEQYYYKAMDNKKNGHNDQARDCFIKAIIVWERIITQLPPSFPDTVHAYYFSAVCYRKLGQYEKAIPYYQYVVDNWPDYQYAWSAQSLVGQCYEKLRNTGTLPESETNPKIEQAYIAVLENYADCSLAPQACLKLANLSLDRQQPLEAAFYFELFLELAKPNDPRIESVEARLQELN